MNNNFKDLTGQRFGRWTVLDFSHKDRYGGSYWLCECDCGTQKIVGGGNLKRGMTKSCGCLRGELNRERSFIDLTGERFGRLTVLDYSHRNNRGESCWLCECDCGKRLTVIGSNLKSGTSKSCGCLRVDNTRKSNTTHGASGTPIHAVWKHMKQRCSNTNDRFYARYGGRGVEVCDEWQDFKNFYQWAMDNGYDPNLKLDRIDNDGDYCPSNCRWADDYVQANNRSSNHPFSYNGNTHTISEWARLLEIPYSTLNKRVRTGDYRDFEAYYDE